MDMALNLNPLNLFRRTEVFIPAQQVIVVGSRGWLWVQHAVAPQQVKWKAYPAQVHKVNADGSLVIEYVTLDCADDALTTAMPPQRRAETFDGWQFEKVD